MATLTQQLRTTSTFLPLLDELLSPDFQPKTPLQEQTLTRAIMACTTIQRWWRRRRLANSYKHKIRHERTEEYVLGLQKEIEDLKLELGREKAMRKVQVEAIRGLYQEVQRVERGQPPVVEKENASSACSCSEQITQLRTAMEREMSELRRAVEELRGPAAARPGTLNLSKDVAGYAGEMAGKIVRGVE